MASDRHRAAGWHALGSSFYMPDVRAAVGAVDASGQQPDDNPARIIPSAAWQQVSLTKHC
jgi:hypothetical protein